MKGRNISHLVLFISPAVFLQRVLIEQHAAFQTNVASFICVNCFQRVCCLKNKEETLYFFLPLNELFKTHLASRSKCASEINGAQLNLAIVGFKTSLFI